MSRRLVQGRVRPWLLLGSRGKSSHSQPVSATTTVNVSDPSATFAHAKTGPFVQEPPQHENPYLGDAFLRRCLARMMPANVLQEVEPDLVRFGSRVSNEVWRLGRLCEENPPFVRQTDAWGKRVDDIVTCDAWKQQKVISAEEGLIAIAYERKQEEFSRLYQQVKLGLFSPASGLYSCPLAMTDGAAKTIEVARLDLGEAFAHLTSRDPAQFWTSGQWMTEKGGGSDVGRGTETMAVQDPEHPGHYRLYGYKWFSSATDSDMTLTLARVVDDDGHPKSEGTKGISMFYVKTRLDDGSLNGIQVAKLKNKLGTRQLPTGELLLDGTVAQLVSPEGRGIPSITNMLLITRLHNSTSSVSPMRKIVLLARDYATRRRAFGKGLHEQLLHVQTLSRMETETRGCTALVLDMAMKLGLADCKKISERDSLLLRLMMPTTKLYTAKQAVATISEGLECFGGQGYIEDTGLPTMMRDAQVLPIWEGTTNVLSLDVLRALEKTGGEALTALRHKVGEVTKSGASSNSPVLKKASVEIDLAIKSILQFAAENRSLLELAGRDLAFSLAHVYIATLLVEQALHSNSASDVQTVQQWLAMKDLAPVVTNSKSGVYEAKLEQLQGFVYEGYNRSNLSSPQ